MATPASVPTLGRQAAADLEAIRHRAAQLAAQLRLPFRTRTWRGQQGNWLGAGIGSSIDFQDHRPYLPGDDPRYIDWMAYARTGNYTMKLYREEVSPSVDLALDISASMSLTEAKTTRALELLYFAAESAWQSAATLRVWLVFGGKLWARSSQQLRDHHWAAEETPPPNNDAPALERIPWRAGSMRVVISDLLHPGAPEAALNGLTANRGHGVLFVPYDTDAEAAPDWAGNLRLIDCETGSERTQRLSADLRERYRNAYRRHFEMWKEEARRRDAVLARVQAEDSLLNALKAEAAPVGAVELAH